ncbi:MAG: isochorismatase family protein [Propionibacteriaceae bacterium]|nr:isochorismatase family protein [Propionibacteriaceae bacterium]
MTTFQNRAATALLVIDAQVGVLVNTVHRDEVVERIGVLVAKARAAGVPVVWVRHSSETLVEASDDWQITAELSPAAGEAIVDKRFGDSFEDTTLGDHLAELAVGHLVICGAQSDACVTATLFGAFVRGYDLTLVSDAHSTEDWSDYGLPAPEGVIALVNLTWQFQKAPGRLVTVVDTESLSFD